MPDEERETIAKATCKYFRDGTTQEVKLNLSETPRGYSLRVTPPGREIRFFSSLLTPISELLNDGETQNLGPNTMGLQDVMLQVNGLYPGLISFHKKYLVLK